MTAKQYLGRLAELNWKIQKLNDEIEERRTRLTSSTMQLREKVQTSVYGDKFADAMAAIADKDLKRQELIFEYEKLRDEIIEQILGMSNLLECQILYKRYVEGTNLKEIAEAMGYSYDWICHAHGNALMHFYQKYLNTTY